MDILHGEVAHQTGIAVVHALVHAVADELSVECSTPDAYLVHVTVEVGHQSGRSVFVVGNHTLTAYHEVPTGDARYAALGDDLHGLSVDIGDGAGATAHVQCEVVPLAVKVVVIRQGDVLLDDFFVFHIADGTGLALDYLQFQTACLLNDAHSVEHREERWISAQRRRAAEPHLYGVVVGLARIEGRHVNHQRLVGHVGGQILIVDIPRLAVHVYVA